MPLPQGYALDDQPASSAATAKLPAGYTLDGQPEAGSQSPDALGRALNYHTGNNWIDAPMGVLQGAAKGAIQTLDNTGNLLNKYVPGLQTLNDKFYGAMGEKAPTPQEQQQLTTSNGIGQGTGKFLEQGLEYALPAAKAAKALDGASLLAKMAGQGGIGAGVSAAQTGGDPTSTIAGGVLGAGGELVKPAIQGIKALAAAKQPTIDNFSQAFYATPSQKPIINKALPLLVKDGITPAAGPVEMREAIQSHLGKLGDQYDALPPDIATRTIAPDTIIDGLQKQQAAFKRGDVITNANKPYYNSIQQEIDDTKALAAQNGGNLSFDDIKHLRDGANGRTSFASPQADQDLYKGVGNVYRQGLDEIAPETTDLNRSYAHYNALDKVLGQNISMGRGTTQSGLSKAMAKVGASETGAAAGFSLGHGIAGPVGGAVGAVAGSMLYPKLAAPVAQAAKNFVESPQFQKMPAMMQNSFKYAAQSGDVGRVLTAMGQRSPLTSYQLLSGSNNQQQ
jgi:hypothetical protein